MSTINHYVTDQRFKMISLFKNHLHESFSAKQIQEKLGDSEISKSAIYRNLAYMEKEGLLTRVTNGNNREVLYQYVKSECCAGAVHLICDNCKSTYHLNKHVSDLISNMALDAFGFAVNKQKSVIYGLCGNCSQNK